MLAAARRVETLPYGLAFFDAELPHVWDLNLAWVDALPGEMTAADLAADEAAVWAAAEHVRRLS